jgi:hypothetical protein
VICHREPFRRDSFLPRGLAPNTWQAREYRTAPKRRSPDEDETGTLEARVSVCLRPSFDRGRSDALSTPLTSSAQQTTTPAKESNIITVRLSNFSFEPDHLRLKTGVPVRLCLVTRAAVGTISVLPRSSRPAAFYPARRRRRMVRLVSGAIVYLAPPR